MAQAGATPPGGGIVKDGLVFRLNGLNQGGIPGHWIDEIGGLDFSGTAVSNESGFVFGNKTYIHCTTSKRFYTKNGTFQTCIKTGTGGGPSPRIFSQADGVENQWSVGFFKNSAWAMGDKIGTVCNAFRAAGPDGTLSLSPSVAFQNLIELTKGDKDWWSVNANNGIYVGSNEPHPLYDYFGGTIHEIRIYNRILSESEILQNQQYDIDTYFGGVIPE